MIAHTKKQKAIIEVSNTLPDITEEQIQYAYKHCFKQVGYRSKTKGTGCLECGHVWKLAADVKSCDCPACGVHITIEDTRKRKLDTGKKYMSILDVRGDYQVVRIFELWSTQEVGKAGRKRIWEVVQQFFTPTTEMEVVARNRTQNYYMDCFGGNLEYRKTAGWNGNKYDEWTQKTYPVATILPEFVRNGYNAKVEGVSHYRAMRKVLHDPKAETLVKAGQYALLASRCGNRVDDITKHWASIKIAMRNNYVLTGDDDLIWLDYLDFLEYFCKDLRSPKYLFPDDLHAAHNKLMHKKRAITEAEKSARELLWEGHRKEAAEKARIKRENAIKNYPVRVGAFAGMLFTNGKIAIKVLESIEEFKKEGEILEHCVFDKEYYTREDALILSARIGDKPIETIELSLKDFSIVQARGYDNKPTSYHSEILKLMNKNIPVIKKTLKNKSIAA